MAKIHVLFKKEELNNQKLKENKVVVVFDILLATSTITTALEYGATEVIPVLNSREAKEEEVGRKKGSYVLVGEYQGLIIEGFHSPHPQALQGKITDKSVILSTTNGTVAIRNASEAQKIYIASLLNAKSVVQKIIENYKNETILLVCAGSSGEFNVEDFYGAGYFIESILTNSGLDFEFTDSAYAALQFYKGGVNKGNEFLQNSTVGRMLTRHGFEQEIEFVLNHDLYDIVPYVKGNKIVKLDKNQKDRREANAIDRN